MSHVEHTMTADVDALVAHLDRAIVAGSEAVFWKLNTFGEEAFLKKAIEALAGFSGGRPEGDWAL